MVTNYLSQYDIITMLYKTKNDSVFNAVDRSLDKQHPTTFLNHLFIIAFKQMYTYLYINT